MPLPALSNRFYSNKPNAPQEPTLSQIPARMQKSEWKTVRSSSKKSLSSTKKSLSSTSLRSQEKTDPELPPLVSPGLGSSSMSSVTVVSSSNFRGPSTFTSASISFSTSLPIPVSLHPPHSPQLSVTPPSPSNLQLGPISDLEEHPQETEGELSDSDDELPPSMPSLGTESQIPSGDSDDLPPILSDDDDMPPPPSLIRQTGYYNSSTSHSCTCLEPEERTSDSYMCES